MSNYASYCILPNLKPNHNLADRYDLKSKIIVCIYIWSFTTHHSLFYQYSFLIATHTVLFNGFSEKKVNHFIKIL